MSTLPHIPDLARARPHVARPHPACPRTPRQTLTHDLAADLEHFARFRRRRHLAKDPRYQLRRAELDDLLDGFEWDLTDRPAPPSTGALRAVAWNIERGKRFEPLLARITHDPELARADLFLLTEVDIGMGRSRNRNVARDLARALGTRYVYANHHLVLSPGDWNERDHSEPNTLAMHGSALLSRHPVRSFRAVALPEYVDKFHHLEKRFGCKRALIAELELPDGPLTVVVAHLDPFAPPRHRAWQLRLILAEVARTAPRRVLFGGDLNTLTYNLASGPSLLVNIADKMLRVGVEGIVAEHLHPDRGRERELFDVLAEARLTLDRFNQRDVGTLFCDTREPELVKKALDYMPQRVFDWMQRKLDPWNGMLPLQLDWFAGYGLEPLHAAVLPRPTWNGELISDHSPILLDLALDHAPAREPLRAPPIKAPTRRYIHPLQRVAVGRRPRRRWSPPAR